MSNDQNNAEVKFRGAPVPQPKPTSGPHGTLSVEEADRRLRLAKIVEASFLADFDRGPLCDDLDPKDEDDRVRIYTRVTEYQDRVAPRLIRAADEVRVALGLQASAQRPPTPPPGSQVHWYIAVNIAGRNIVMVGPTYRTHEEALRALPVAQHIVKTQPDANWPEGEAIVVTGWRRVELPS